MASFVFKTEAYPKTTGFYKKTFYPPSRVDLYDEAQYCYTTGDENLVSWFEQVFDRNFKKNSNITYNLLEVEYDNKQYHIVTEINGLYKRTVYYRIDEVWEYSPELGKLGFVYFKRVNVDPLPIYQHLSIDQDVIGEFTGDELYCDSCVAPLKSECNCIYKNIVNRVVKHKIDKMSFHTYSQLVSQFVDQSPLPSRSIMLLYKIKVLIDKLKSIRCNIIQLKRFDFRAHNSIEKAVEALELEYIQPEMPGDTPLDDLVDQQHPDKASTTVLTTHSEVTQVKEEPSIMKDYFSKASSADGLHTFSYLTDRWILLQKKTWNVKKLTTDTMVSLRLFGDVLSTLKESPVTSMFNYFAYMKTDLVFRVHINTSQFHVGQLIAAFYYSAALDNYENMRYTVAGLLQMPHVKIDASKANEVELVIPYKYYKSMIRLKPTAYSDDYSYGRFMVMPIVPITTRGGCKNVDVSVFVKFQNTVFSGLVPKEFKVTSRLLKTDSDDEYDYIQPEMMSIKKIVNATSDTLDMLIPDPNRDDPPSTDIIPTRIIPSMASNWSSGRNDIDFTESMRLIPQGQTPHPIGSSDNVETNILAIARKPGLLRQLVWDLNEKTPITPSLIIPVDPIYDPTQDTDYKLSDVEKTLITISATTMGVGKTAWFAPPITHITNFMQYWRGSIVYTFEVISSPYQTGSVICAFIPSVTVIKAKEYTIADLRSCYNAVFDIRETRTFKFRVPYIADKPWWPRLANMHLENSPYYVMEPTGVLCFAELNRMCVSSAAPLQLWINVYVEAGDDFELAIPTTPLYSNVYDNSIYISSVVRIKEGYYPDLWFDEWQYCKGKLCFRYGEGSDHITQFVGDVNPTTVYKVNTPSAKTRMYMNTLAGGIQQVVYAVSLIVNGDKDTYKYMTPFYKLSDAKAFAAKNKGWADSDQTLMVGNGGAYQANRTNVNDYGDMYLEPISTVARPEMDQEQPILDPSVHSLASTMSGLMTFGEKFVDLKDINRRYNHETTIVLPVKWGDSTSTFVQNSVRCKIPVTTAGIQLKANDLYDMIVRQSIINYSTSAFRFSRGSLRYRLVFESPGDYNVKVQHIPEILLTPRNVQLLPSGSKKYRDFIKPGYSIIEQNIRINPCITIEVPFYNPGVFILNGEPNMEYQTEFPHFTSGYLAISIDITPKISEYINTNVGSLVISVYKAYGDDFSPSVYVGFPPIIKKVEYLKGDDKITAEPEMMSSIKTGLDYVNPVNIGTKFCTAVGSNVVKEAKEAIYEGCTDIMDNIKNSKPLQTIMDMFPACNRTLLISVLTTIIICVINPNIKTIAVSIISYFAQVGMIALDSVTRLAKVFADYLYNLVKEKPKFEPSQLRSVVKYAVDMKILTGNSSCLIPYVLEDVLTNQQSQVRIPIVPRVVREGDYDKEVIQSMIVKCKKIHKELIIYLSQQVTEEYAKQMIDIAIEKYDNYSLHDINSLQPTVFIYKNGYVNDSDVDSLYYDSIINQPSTSHEVQPEGFADFMDHTPAVVSTSIIAILGILKVGKSTLKWNCIPDFGKTLLHDIKDFSLTANHLFIFFRNTASMFKDMFLWISRKCCPENRFLSSLVHDKQHICQWIEEANWVLDEANDKLIRSNPRYTLRVYYAAFFAEQLRKQYITADSSTLTRLRCLEQLFKAVINKRNELQTDRLCPEVREEPFVLSLDGDTNVGKSHLGSTISYHLAKKYKWCTGGEIIYVKAPNNKYYNGLKNQPVLLFDDFAQINEENPYLLDQITDLFNLKSSAIYNPPMAAVEEKNLRYNPKLVVLCTNTPYPVPQGIASVSAFHRRRDMMISIRWKKEFKDKTVLTLPSIIKNTYQHLQFAIRASSTKNDVIPEDAWLDSLEELYEKIEERYDAFYENESNNFQMRLNRLRSVQEENLDILSLNAIKEEYHAVIALAASQGTYDYAPLKQQVMETYSGYNIEKKRKYCTLLNKNIEMESSNIFEDITSALEAMDLKVQPEADFAIEENVDCMHLLCFPETLKGFDITKLKDSIYISRKEVESCVSPALLNEEVSEIYREMFKGNTEWNLSSFNEGLFILPQSKSFIPVPVAKCCKKGKGTTDCIMHDELVYQSFRKAIKYWFDNLVEDERQFLLRFSKGEKAEDNHLPFILLKDLLFEKTPVKISKAFEECVQNAEKDVTWLSKGVRYIWTLIKGLTWVLCKMASYAVFFGGMSALVTFSNPLSESNIRNGINGAIVKTTKDLTGSNIAATAMGLVVHKGDLGSSLKSVIGTEVLWGGKKNPEMSYTQYNTKAVPTIQGAIKIIRPEMADEIYSNLRRIIRRNTVFIRVQKVDSYIDMRGIGLCGTNILVVDHMVDYIRKSFDDDSVEKILVFINGMIYEIQQGDIDVLLLEDSVYRIINCKFHMPKFKSLVKYMQNQKASGACAPDGYLVEPTLIIDKAKPSTYTVDITIHRQSTLEVAHNVAITGDKSKGIQPSCARDCYTYQTSGLGKCMSVLLANYNTPSPIIGFHVAGLKSGNKGFAELIVSESFQSLINKDLDVIEPEMAPVEFAHQQLDTNVIQIGVLAKEYHQRITKESKQRHSVIYNKFHESTYDFPVLTRTDERIKNDPFSPLLEGCKLHGKVPHEFDKDLLDICAKDLSHTLKTKCPPIRKYAQLLTDQVAVCGDPMASDLYQPIDLSTSEGFPYSKFRPQGFSSKRWLFDINYNSNYPQLISIHPMVQEIRDIKKIQRLNNQIPFTLFTDSLKDLKMPAEKCIIPGKTRVFSLCPVDFLLDVRVYFGDFVASYTKARLSAEHAVGINVNSYEWTDLANYLLSNSEHIVTGDYKNFGPTLMAACVSKAFEIIREWYHFNSKDFKVDPNDDLIRYILGYEMTYSYHLMEDLVYQVCCGAPSGSPLTVVLNNLVNGLYIRYAWLCLMKNTGIYSSLKDFHDNVRVIFYGDDIIMSVKECVLEYFNAKKISDLFAQYNIIFTDSAKSNCIKPSSSLYDEETTFLKCHFVPHPYRSGTILPRIDKRAILEVPNWIFKTKDEYAATAQAIQSMFVGLYGHGEEFYEHNKEKIIRILKENEMLYHPSFRNLNIPSWRDVDLKNLGM
nr:hypothetical protein [Chrysopa pallens]